MWAVGWETEDVSKTMLGLSQMMMQRMLFAKKPAQRLSSIWTRPVCSSLFVHLIFNVKPVL